MPQFSIDGPNALFEIICPSAKCRVQTVFLFDTSQRYNFFTCPQCNASFNTRIVKVRAGRSQHQRVRLGNSLLSPIVSSRQFSVRVKDLNGIEDLVEFTSYSPQTFEFRSSDIVGFTFANNEFKVVQNFTIERWMPVVNVEQKKGLFGTKITLQT